MVSTGMHDSALLDGYAAKRCIRRTYNRFDPSVPSPPPAPQAVLLRMAEGRVFETDVVIPALQTALGDRCVVIADGDHPGHKQRRIEETTAAMTARVPVIISGQLPDDPEGRRTGSPDVLYRVTPETVPWAQYVPVDIKNHITLRPSENGSALVSDLTGPLDSEAPLSFPGRTRMTSHRVEDTMQLAHYLRMLQAMGRASSNGVDKGRVMAGVIGTSDFTEVTGQRHGIVWYSLAAVEVKTWSASAERGLVRRSVLDVYDHEFAARLRVVDAAVHGDEVVRPFNKAECDECPYASWCRDHVGPDDASFSITTGRLTDREWDFLYGQGLGTVAALAQAAPKGTLMAGFQAAASDLPVPEKRLSDAVRRARMRRDGVPLEAVAAEKIVVPTADVEIDFDVEWHPSDGHVYQWGARVRYGSDEATATYRHSVLSFDNLDDAAAHDLAQRFLTWMEDFVDEHEAAGRTVGIYHWTTPETRLAAKMLDANRAERLFQGRFVDLHAFMRDRFFARDGLSLKVVAPLFGFAWRADDAGGATSILKIEQARDSSDPGPQQAAREWLLRYNEDDCAAQAAIRDGLRDQQGTGVVSKTAPVPPAKQAPPASNPTPEPLAPQSSQTASDGPSDARAAVVRAVGQDRLLAMNEIRRRVAQFVIDYADITSERQGTADFWKALMRCYGVDDSRTHGVTFEYPAIRSDTGREGRIDVFMPGRYLIEQKSAGRIRTPKAGSESNAEQQAKAYLTGGSITRAQMPRWLVTSDFQTFQVTDLTQPARSAFRTRTIRFDELNDNVELFLFLAGDDPDAMLAEEQAEASIEAARLMGDLYAAMTGDSDIDADDISDASDESERSMEASVLLTRLLFLMFGDDAGLWQKGLFQRFVETRTSEDGTDLGQHLRSLFEVLDTPEQKRHRNVDEAAKAFPYVNGDIYKDARHDQTMWFNTDMREALLAACRFDWSRISSAVFGSLFQTVKSKKARRFDGEHYTSEENILKTLRPLFLDELRRRLDAANTKPQLEALHADLSRFRFVDPACGCGNFLIVAYREMRALELELLVKLKALQGRQTDLVLDPSAMLNVRLDQCYGIEVNWWPAKIAETAMYLVDHQANQRMLNTLGLPVTRLPINISANIHHGNALTTDWDHVLPGNETDGRPLRLYVFGNPPFLGRGTTNSTQKRELAEAWGRDGTAHLDFVTAWHAKTLTYLTDRDGEFAFVTTNSVTQGEPVADLFPRIEDAGWHIKFAHRTFAWNSEAASQDRAAVHCVIVGFTTSQTAKPRLFDYPTPKSPAVEQRVTQGINGYLLDGPNVYATARSNPLSELPGVSFGSMPRDGGHLVVTAAAYADVMADPIAAKYVRRYVGGEELINNRPRWCLWLMNMDPADARRSTLLRDRLENVRDTRLKSSATSTQEWAQMPHLFVQRAQPTGPYLAIPRVFSEGRLYATADRLPEDVIASDQLFTCPDPDGFAFAVISSTMFIVWQRTVGGRLESRLRFSKDVVWNNFPLPPVTAGLRRQIITAGEAVLTARALHPDRSLADAYNPLAMAPDLVAAHRSLDRVVDKAFGVHGSRKMTEFNRQELLFDKYTELLPSLT